MAPYPEGALNNNVVVGAPEQRAAEDLCYTIGREVCRVTASARMRKVRAS